MAGDLYYSCGHCIHDPNAPQDADWQSEVPCPECRADIREEEMETP